MPKALGKKPDMELKAMDIETRRSSRAGAAWVNKDGSISITLNHCIVLNAHDPIRLTLFPITPSKKKKS